MDEQHELEMIGDDIEDARKRLTLFRRLLAEKLGPHGGTDDTVLRVIAGCDEWGAEKVIGDIADHPQAYNLSALPDGLMSVVGPLIEQVADAGYDFDRMVVAREHILCSRDPTRDRRYPIYGREAVLDRAARTMRYVDPPTSEEPLEVVAVPNRSAPTVTPDATPTPKRRRRRARDR